MEQQVPDDMFADLVLLNGKIITVDANDSIAEAVACKEERIMRVGKREEITPYIGKRTRVVDLQGKT
jgi:hypothetical protein